MLIAKNFESLFVMLNGLRCYFRKSGKAVMSLTLPVLFEWWYLFEQTNKQSLKAAIEVDIVTH